MTEPPVTRLIGLSGIAIGVLGLVIVPLYFVYEDAPPGWNVLTRVLLNLLAAVLLLVFLAALRQLIRRARPEYEWPAGLMFGAGVAYTTATLVAGSLEAGIVFDAGGGAVDPTVHGVLAHANVLLHGSASRLLTALLLTAAGYAVLRSRVLPRWVAVSAFVTAAINLAFVPSLYTSIDPAQFYSALGWGNTALAAALLTYWAFAVGISALRIPRPRT
ncbi:hypothetical protein [Amycolatopsis samaneae]|uniref:DUF4386 domain-containing protein n=1 Tax=Amycolatopsis samaneae TaxID=664691 RepID=A0ABW5G8W3_9PSEU